MSIVNGWLSLAERIDSPHYHARASLEDISLLVIHNISLPPGKFGGNYVSDLFTGKLDPNIDPYFEDIYQLRVSAHCLIRRDGHIIQYVSFDDCAWHAGVSQFKTREKCNEFSIGIELEGTDDIPYTGKQYQQLSLLTAILKKHYKNIADNIVGHSDIAPGRKTDPGQVFDWQRFNNAIKPL
jgi:AmpD protein